MLSRETELKLSAKLSNNSKSLFGLAGPDHRTTAVNKTTIKTTGITENQWVGEHFENLPGSIAELANDFIYENNLIFHEGVQNLFTLNIHCYPAGLAILHTQKYPVKDEQSNIVAVAFESSVIDVRQFRKLPQRLLQLANNHNKKGQLNKIYRSHPDALIKGLTRKERYYFPYLARGYSAKTLANLFCVSIRTVDTHINHIKNKLGVKKKSDIVELANSSGLLHYIPEECFNPNFSFILSKET